MPRVKIQLADNIKRVVVVDTEATRGATIGTNVYNADGSLYVPASGGGGAGNFRAGYGILFQGGNPKTISVNRAADFAWQGQHSWEKPLWAPHGTAALPAVTWADDPDTGPYRVGANNYGISTDGTLRWDVDTARTYQSLPLVVHTPNGRAAFFTNADDTIYDSGLEVNTKYNPDGSDIELNFWERASGQNRFRWYLYGEPTAQAYFSLYRHDNSAGGNEILRFTRDTAGGDWLETCRIADGTFSTPSLAFTSAPGVGIYYGGSGNEGMFVAATRFRVVQNSSSDNARVQAQNLSSSGASSYGLVNHTNNSLWLVRLANSGSVLEQTIGADLTYITNNTNRWVLENSTGYFRALDNIELRLGTGGDLRLFHNGTNSTIRNDTGNLSINSGATEVLRFIQGANSRVHALNGSAALPTFGWFGDPDNGLYYITTNSFGISLAGTLRYQFGAAGQLGIGGANYGTADTQAIVSGGASAAPSWQTVLVDGQTQTLGGDKTWTGLHTFVVGPNGVRIQSSLAGTGAALYFQGQGAGRNRFRYSHTSPATSSFFAIRDDTAEVDRLLIEPDGSVRIPGGFYLTGLGNYADDAAAAAGGIAVNQLYRNGSVVMIRVS